MKPSQIRKLLIKLAALHEPVLLKGSPGIGKTATVEQLAAELKYELIVTHPVVDDPTDYKGMPAVIGRDTANPSAKFLPFGDLWRMIDAEKPTIVFMDDLGQAPPAVQAAVMQLVLARHINGHKISDKIWFLAATNRRQDKAAVTGLITPLLDRFTAVLNYEFDLEDWIRWALQNDLPPVLAAFARFKPDLIAKFEPNKDMVKSPTPRSVAKVGTALLALGIDDAESVASVTGEGFATEFLAFYRVWSELPDRTEIYLNPDTTPVPGKDKADVLYALMGSLAHGATKANFEQTVRYLNRVPAEFSVLCVKDAISRNKDLKRAKAFTQWALDHAEVFGYEEA